MAKCKKCGNCAKSGCDYCRPCMDELGIDYTGKKSKKHKREKEQCNGTTQKGTRCRIKVRKGKMYCKQHQYQAPSKPQIVSSNGSRPPTNQEPLKKQKRQKRKSVFIEPDRIIHNTPQSKRFTWEDREGYREYTKTKHWTTVRLYMLKKEPHCAFCGTDKELQVHHKTYEHVWEERDHELSVLCKTHHYALHDFDNGLLISINREAKEETIDYIDYGCEKLQLDGFGKDIPQEHKTNDIFYSLYKEHESYFRSKDFKDLFWNAYNNGDIRCIDYLGRFLKVFIDFDRESIIEHCVVCGGFIYRKPSDYVDICEYCLVSEVRS